MSVTRFRFQPPWWSWFALVLTATILAGLGTWQLQRAQAKEQILAQREVAGKAEAANLAAASDPQALYGHAVAASGAYTQRQILLDNQVWQGRVGYRVWTPLVLDDGRLVLVDRGWVGGAGNRQRLPQPPVPAGSLEIRGYWRALPQPGLLSKTPIQLVTIRARPRQAPTQRLFLAVVGMAPAPGGRSQGAGAEIARPLHNDHHPS